MAHLLVDPAAQSGPWRTDPSDYYNPQMRLPGLSSHHSTVTSDDHPMPGCNETEKPRRRIQVACSRCRKRKIKCSGAIEGGPCINCRNSRVENDGCKFDRVQSKSLDCEWEQLATSSSMGASRHDSTGSATDKTLSALDYSKWASECDAGDQGDAKTATSNNFPFGYTTDLQHFGPPRNRHTSIAPDNDTPSPTASHSAIGNGTFGRWPLHSDAFASKQSFYRQQTSSPINPMLLGSSNSGLENQLCRCGPSHSHGAFDSANDFSGGGFYGDQYGASSRRTSFQPSLSPLSSTPQTDFGSASTGNAPLASSPLAAVPMSSTNDGFMDGVTMNGRYGGYSSVEGGPLYAMPSDDNSMAFQASNGTDFSGMSSHSSSAKHGSRRSSTFH